MKRSEMIELMCKQPFIFAHGILEERLAKEEADAILTFLEDHGMKPPEIETTHWNRQDNDYYKENAWED